MAYKYLLWDVDGTVLDFQASEAIAIKELFKEYNIGECTDEMLKQYSEINTKYWQALERNEMTKPEILVGRFVEFFESRGIDTSIAERFNRSYQLALGDHIVFVKGAKEELLREKGSFVLVAVTNGTKVAQEKKLRCSGLDKIFDYIFISEDMGAEKPNAEYFDRVFEALNLRDKSEALIIGDSLTSDMKGGVTAGIDTCWFNLKHSENKSGLKLTYEIDDLAAVKEILS
ncbi:MAG: YjjG family noncanonical pyrimidine nucleotidase [Lachnospiraceae bacterium]|nr:YjjG family noncanonical pyrimidine nucleotidase [Lachnospiraceae bacterium]